MSKRHAMFQIQRKAPRPATAVAEPLESRRLLSGYGYQQLEKLSFQQLTTPKGTPVEDKAGDIFFFADVGETSQEAVWELAKGAATPTMVVALTGTQQSSTMVIDSSGDLFGADGNGGTNGVGELWEIASGSNTVTSVVSFTRATTGGDPAIGQIVIDSNNNIYGFCLLGGANNGGTVWEYQQSTGSLSTLVALQQTEGFGERYGGLSIDSQGNLYGTLGEDNVANNYGSIWEVPAGTGNFDVLATFNGTNGNGPNNPLVIDSAGDVFGTCYQGGPTGYTGVGTIFEIVKGSGTATVLASFDGTNGWGAIDGLFADSGGDLLGATGSSGLTGDSPGTIFELAKGSSSITTLYTGTSVNGSLLLMDSSGALIKIDQGNAFEVVPGGGGGGGGGGGNTTGVSPEPLSSSVPAAVVGGTKLHASLKLHVYNPASTVEKGFTVKVFASTDLTLDSSDTPITSVTRPTAIKGGKSVALTIPITSLPASLPKGTYYLVMEAIDSAGNTNASSLSQAFTVAPPTIELVPTFTAAPVVGHGNTATVSLTIANNGNTAPAGKSQVELLASPSDTASGATKVFGETISLPIKPGKFSKVKIHLTSAEVQSVQALGVLVAEVIDPLGGSQSAFAPLG